MKRYVVEGSLGFCGTDFVVDLGKIELESEANACGYDEACQQAESAGAVFEEDYSIEDYNDETTMAEQMNDDCLHGMIIDGRENLDYCVREYEADDEDKF